MLISAFFLMSNAFGQKDFYLKLYDGKYINATTEGVSAQAMPQIWTIAQNGNTFSISTKIGGETYYLTQDPSDIIKTSDNKINGKYSVSKTVGEFYIFKENSSKQGQGTVYTELPTEGDNGFIAIYNKHTTSGWTGYYIFRYNYSDKNFENDSKLMSTSSSDSYYLKLDNNIPSVATISTSIPRGKTISPRQTTVINFEEVPIPSVKYGKFSFINSVEGGTASCAEIPSGTSWEGQSEDIAGPATKTFTLTATASNDDYTFKGWSDDGGKTIIDGSNQSPFTYTFSYSSTDEGSPTTVTLTPVFSAGLNFYLMNYDTGNYLNASGTKMSFKSEPQIWLMEESGDYMKISPDGENYLTYSNSYVRLSSSATKYCYLYEIEDIKATTWSGTLTKKPTPGKYYFIVLPSSRSDYYYAMGNYASSGNINVQSNSQKLSNSKFTMTNKSDNKQYVYQLVKPTPAVTYYGELTVVAKDNLGTVSISEATSGNNVWSGSAKGYTGSATKVLNVSATPSEGYTFVGWSENGTDIISSEANYEYSFTFNGTEDAPQKATLTAVFAEKVSYFVYNLGNKQFLYNSNSTSISSTSLKFSDTPQEWVIELVAENLFRMKPESGTNNLYRSSSSYKLGNHASEITEDYNNNLFEIEDINSSTWTAKLTNIVNPGKYYLVASWSDSKTSFYVMGNIISSNTISATKNFGFNDAHDVITVENTDANKAYVYQFTKSAYNIPVTSVEWASFYADFDVTIPQSVTAYTATGIDSGKITLAEVEGDVIPAKTAVVFSAAEGKVSFVNKGSVTTFSGTNLFEGSSVEKNIKTESCYTLCGVNNGNPVFKLYTGTILAANKAYLPIPQGTEVKEMLSSVFDGANGIANINVNNEANSVRYNLNGQVVGKDFKGVVIMNGKKYLSK